MISILAGVAPDFPRNLWSLVLPQTELTLILLRQATLDPSISSWSYFRGPFNYEATPIGTLGCDIIAHKNMGTRHLWDFRGAVGWNVGVALQHYRCHTIVAKSTRAAQVSDTVEFRHNYLTQPTVTPMDRIFHGMTTLTCALYKTPTIACDSQLALIQALHQVIQRWSKLTLTAQTKPHLITLPPTSTRQRSILRPMRFPHKDRPQDVPPMVVIKKPDASLIPPTVPSTISHYEPVARRTRSRVSQTMDQPPPRVSQTSDTGPIVRLTQSQTASLASIITPAQAVQ